MQDISADSSNLLREKLTLSRELSTLKPEVEHLRAQAQAHENLLGEKLSLQRELKTAQAQIDSEGRRLDRAKVIESNVNTKEAEHLATIEQLRENLAEAEKALTRERLERGKIEKATQASTSLEAEKAVLENKLDQFRTKLRSTKEKLKDTEAELRQAQECARTAETTKFKNPRKRTAIALDPDATIGTPGDAAPNKRSKRASSIVGEKSTFSITPFLNRTSGVALGDADQDEPVTSIEVVVSPSTTRAASLQPQSRSIGDSSIPLARASDSEVNVKASRAGRQKVATKSLTLANVVEEEEEEVDVIVDKVQLPGAKSVILETSRAPSLKPTLKPKARPSLSSFASFRELSLPPQQKKKRKLLSGGAAKTLFDEGEDEGDAGPSRATSGAIQRPLGAFGGAKSFKAFGALGGKKKGPLVVADDGFAFSPLKKDRKAAALKFGAAESA